MVHVRRPQADKSPSDQGLPRPARWGSTINPAAARPGCRAIFLHLSDRLPDKSISYAPDRFHEHCAPVKPLPGRQMISRADEQLKRAVEYDRLMKCEADPTWEIVFRVMRDLWLEMANETSMSPQEPAPKVTAIEPIQLPLKSARTTTPPRVQSVLMPGLSLAVVPTAFHARSAARRTPRSRP
jgi:hypothetical protein